MRIALALLALLLAACAPDIIYIVAEPEPAPAAAPVEETVPVWIPEPWHIYVLDSAGAILVDELAQPESTYRLRYTCWALDVEQHNLEPGAESWRVVGGGMS